MCLSAFEVCAEPRESSRGPSRSSSSRKHKHKRKRNGGSKRCLLQVKEVVRMHINARTITATVARVDKETGAWRATLWIGLWDRVSHITCIIDSHYVLAQARCTARLRCVILTTRAPTPIARTPVSHVTPHHNRQDEVHPVFPCLHRSR